jgi:hypothetical protein
MINRIKKMILMSCLITSAYSFSHRDGCTEIAQKCVCQNTHMKGFCFPGSNSKYKGELYCNCQADVYSPYELARNWVIQFIQAKPLKKITILAKYPAIAPTITQLAKSLQQEILAGAFGVKMASQESAYQPLISYMTERPLLGEFFELRDNCQYIEQPCTCKNSRIQGICSMNYPKEGKSFNTNVLYCHCD